MNRVLVTGATGTVGSHVVEGLSEREDVRVRVASRRPDRATGSVSENCERVRFDFTDPATYRGTFADVDSVFLVRPPAISRVRRDIVPALAAAVGAGVERIVFLSVLGADRNPLVPHARIESWLESAPVETSFLRASFFMQNLATTHRREIRQGEFAVPAGRGRTSFVDARDVAAVGVRALARHVDGAVDLTGPEALSYREVCERLSSVLPHVVTYTSPSLPRFCCRRYGVERSLAKCTVMAGIYTTVRLGLAGRVTDDVRRILDREAIDFDSFARDYREVWI